MKNQHQWTETSNTGRNGNCVLIKIFPDSESQCLIILNLTLRKICIQQLKFWLTTLAQISVAISK